MPERIQLVPHLTTEELADAARNCDDAAKRTRIEAIRLVSMGWDFVRVGVALDFRRGWVRELVRRFNGAVLAGLDDQRASNVGREPLLNADGMAALREALAGPAPDGGLWSGPKVRAWISARLEKPVGKRAGWRTLQRAGFSLQRPQTRHASADVEAQEDFKKKSSRSSKISRPPSPKRVSKSGPRTKPGSD
jgi:transposase